MFVRTRMTANPYTVGPDNSVPEAVAIMEEHKVRWLPVVKEGRLVGVLSEGDIAKAMPSKATSLAAGEVLYLLEKLKVSQVMSPDPIIVAPDALLEEAALLMRDHKVEMLPVVEDGRVVGVITDGVMFDTLIEMLGFRDSGTRLTIELDDRPGVLMRVGAITAKHRTNITHVAVIGTQFERAVIVLGLNSLKTDEIEAELAEAGYNVIYKLRNN
jgi:acetoin utilization protein AcuB